MSGMEVDGSTEAIDIGTNGNLNPPIGSLPSGSGSSLSANVSGSLPSTSTFGLKIPFAPSPGSPHNTSTTKESKSSIMAPAGTVGSVSISLHPLVILNISEHWTRVRAEEKKNVQVIGAVIGKQNGRSIEIMNSFELAFDLVENEIVINRDYYAIIVGLYKQTFSEMELLGWYTTGDVPNDSDLKIQKQFCDILDFPIFLKLNPLSSQAELPISVYESVVDVIEDSATLLLVELPYTLATEEAERIGIDHVARIRDCSQNSMVNETLQAQHNAVKMLSSRVHIISEYVRATQEGEIPYNHEILRQINALVHRLPVINSLKFKDEFYNQTNDVALIAYLGSITKSCNAMNKYITRFNQLHERFSSIGRRMRGLLF